MKEEFGYEEYNLVKEKRHKKIQAKPNKKVARDKDFQDFDRLLGKKKKFKQRADRSFRNNYKNFEYDYEEDFYEPRN